ncbi:MAG: hypothetical protein IK078_04345, partial [Lachnospiraceae bacterium]|nr:hypothetical protein [Lachnospiraceae bacterium]
AKNLKRKEVRRVKKFNGVKGIVILLILVVMIVGYYYYLSSRGASRTEEDISEVEILTPTKQVLLRDLETNYPPTPREVVKYFSEISQCFYNEDNTEEEIEALGRKAREIYDDQLVANQTEAVYLEALKMDIQSYKDNNRIIVGYSPSSSVDVETFSEDGYDWARLYCEYSIRQGELLYNTDMVFVLRKDENEHYKIFGWRKMEKHDESVTNP